MTPNYLHIPLFTALAAALALAGCDSDDPEPGNTLSAGDSDGTGTGTGVGAGTDGTGTGTGTGTDGLGPEDSGADSACFPECFAHVECCDAYGLSGEQRTACEQAQGAFPYWRCSDDRGECEPTDCGVDQQCIDAGLGDTCDAGICRFACTEIEDCPNEESDCVGGFCSTPSVEVCQGDYREGSAADCTEPFPICNEDGLCYDCDGNNP